MFGNTVEDVSQQEALTGQGEVVTYSDQLEDLSGNTGGEFLPDAVAALNLSPPPVTPYSPTSQNFRVDTSNVTGMTSALDVPVPDDDDMDEVPNEGELQEFNDGEGEPEDEPAQMLEEGAEEEEYLDDELEEEDVTDYSVGDARNRQYR
eukprot:4599838-Amphidinium_carterae.1